MPHNAQILHQRLPTWLNSNLWIKEAAPCICFRSLKQFSFSPRGMELQCLDQGSTDDCYSKVSSTVAMFSNERACPTLGTTSSLDANTPPYMCCFFRFMLLPKLWTSSKGCSHPWPSPLTAYSKATSSKAPRRRLRTKWAAFIWCCRESSNFASSTLRIIELSFAIMIVAV